MRALIALQFGQRFAIAAGGRDSEEGAAEGGRKDDPAIAGPGGAANVSGRAKDHRRAAIERDLLQDSGGGVGVGDPTSIGREKWRTAAFGAGDGSEAVVTKGTGVNPAPAILTVQGGGDAGAIGREGESAIGAHVQGEIGGQVDTDPGGRNGRRSGAGFAPDGVAGEGEDYRGKRPGEKRAPGGYGSGGSGSGRFIERDTRLADIAQAELGVFAQAAFEEAAKVRGRVFGERGVIGFAGEHGGERIRDGFAAAEQHFSGQEFVENDAEGPDIGAAVHDFAARLFRGHVGGGAEDHAGLGHGEREGGRHGGTGAAALDSVALARPKSRSFTMPSGVTLILAGFRSRWMMPRSWAASSAAAIWRA